MASTQQPANVDPGVKFENFDDKDVFQKYEQFAASRTCQNFVVDFGPRQARIARDLDAKKFSLILNDDNRGDDFPIRWM
jgi:hypothetical protein